jgi:hypothetical protein
MRTGRFGGMVAAVALASVEPAGADASDPPAPADVRVDYRAATGCPTAAYFRASIAARTSLVRFADTDDVTRAFVLDVAVDGDRARGVLRVLDASGAESARQLAGVTCREVVDALALVAALAIDPRASTAPLAIAPAEPEPAPAPPSTPAPPPRVAPAAIASASAPAPSRSRWAIGAGVGAGVVDAGLPEPAYEVAPGLVARRGGGRLLELGVAFVRVASGGDATADGMVDLTWNLGRAEACLAIVELVGITASACARVDAGALVAQGVDVPNPRRVTRPWVAPGAALTIGRAIGPVLVRAGVGIDAPLVRDRFELAPDVELAATPAVQVRGAVGIVVMFW